jgi:hypothetical protein
MHLLWHVTLHCMTEVKSFSESRALSLLFSLLYISYIPHTKRRERVTSYKQSCQELTLLICIFYMWWFFLLYYLVENHTHYTYNIIYTLNRLIVFHNFMNTGILSVQCNNSVVRKWHISVPAWHWRQQAVLKFRGRSRIPTWVHFFFFFSGFCIHVSVFNGNGASVCKTIHVCSTLDEKV